MEDIGDSDVVALAPTTTVVRQQATAAARNRDAASSWTGSNLSAGGGRGLVAVKEALRIVAHIDMDAFYAQIEQVRAAAFCVLVSCKFACGRSHRVALLVGVARGCLTQSTISASLYRCALPFFSVRESNFTTASIVVVSLPIVSLHC